MEIKMKKTLTALALIATSTFAQAELVLQDYEAAGDNGIIFDTETENQWLTIRYTDGMIMGDAFNLYTDKGWKIAEFETASELMVAANTMSRAQFTSMMGVTYIGYGLGNYWNQDKTGFDTAIWGTSYTSSVGYYQRGYDLDIQSHNMGLLLYRNIEDVSNVSAPLLGFAGLSLFGMAGLRRKK